MANVTILVPRRSMLEQARQVLEQTHYRNITVGEVKLIRQTSNAVNEARDAVNAGADIIVARGLQAMYIKEHTNIPVVEIILTGQELALLVRQAKELLGKEHPHIAFVGNVFSDMSRFEELFGVTLSLYAYRSMEEHVGQIARAVESGVDIIIGGDLSNQQARQHGVPSLFFTSTEESIREALRVADLTAYAMDLEKRHTAHMEALMEAYTSGIIMIDGRRNITKINHIAEEMLSSGEKPLEGSPVHAALPGVDVESLDRLLAASSDVYHATLEIGGRGVTVWATPIKEGGQVLGASLVLTSAGGEGAGTALKSIKAMYLRGHTAQSELRHLAGASKRMNRMIDTAKLYAMSQSPVLITGPVGTEKELVAQGIHQASVRKNGPYVSVDCMGLGEAEQEALLFGGKRDGEERQGALEVSSYGTLLLNDVDALTLGNQYRLFRAISSQAVAYSNVRPRLLLDIRLLAATAKDLEAEMRQGRFREDLFYTLHSLVLEVPSVRHRPEDRRALLQAAVRACAETYHRQISLAAEAWEVLTAYDWPGNLIQIRGFAERLVLTAPKAKVDAAFARHLLGAMFQREEGAGRGSPAMPGSPEAARITALLEKHFGNRAAVAKELQISTTTLWRRMKKHGVLPDSQK